MADTPEDPVARLERLKKEYQELYGVTWEEQQEFYALMGQGISFWSAMETHLVRISARLLGTTSQRAGVLMYSITSPWTWLQIIDDLFLLTPEYSSQRAAYNKQAAAIRKLIDTRNRLAHHTTIDGLKKTSVKLLRPELDMRSKSLAQQPLSIEEIRKFISAVNEISNRLGEIWETLPITLPVEKTPNAPVATG
jgi:hypothetical protein